MLKLALQGDELIRSVCLSGTNFFENDRGSWKGHHRSGRSSVSLTDEETRCVLLLSGRQLTVPEIS